jgi:hypothetical protein
LIVTVTRLASGADIEDVVEFNAVGIDLLTISIRIEVISWITSETYRSK